MEIPQMPVTNNKRTLLISILAITGVIIIATLFILFQPATNQPPLISSVQKKAPPPTPTPPRSTMYTTPLTINTTVGQQTTLIVTIDAKNHVINGLDSVIGYDPAFIKVVSVAKADKIDPEFTLLRRQIQEKQIVLTAAKTSYSETATIEMQVALITLQAVKAGSTQLTFEHTPGATTGSTVIQAEGSVNILDEVTNTTVIIE